MATSHMSSFGRAFQSTALRPRTALRTVTVRAERVLIVNTKKGGHAFLGLHLANALLKKGCTVTILNDGDSSIEAKAPFSEYAGLARAGATIMYGSPTDPGAFPTDPVDVVVDNNGKSMEDCQPLIDHYASSVRQYCFIGSAGAYVYNGTEPMHVEGDPRKPKAGHVQVEAYLERVGAPFTVFQPLYMYGPHTAKDCEQWFIDRIIRDRPVPIPAPGQQLTSVSHVEDVAALVAAAIGNPAALRQHYNAATDRAVTLDGLAHAVARALGRDAADIVHYDPDQYDIPKGQGFPFRAVHFFPSVDKAKRELGWRPIAANLEHDMAEQVAIYKAQGRDKKDVDFPVDDLILARA